MNTTGVIVVYVSSGLNAFVVQMISLVLVATGLQTVLWASSNVIEIVD